MDVSPPSDSKVWRAGMEVADGRVAGERKRDGSSGAAARLRTQLR